MNAFKLAVFRTVSEVTLRRCTTQSPLLSGERRLLDPRPTTLLQQRGRKAPPARMQEISRSRIQKSIPKPKPIPFDYSGDIERALPNYDLSLPRLEFQDSEELPKAHEDVKKILSLEFGTSHDLRDKRIDEIEKAVQEHPADIASLEVRIARMTILIRNQLPHATQFRKDKVAKVRLIHRIQARKKLLKFLRLKDREKFDWLLKELKIKYVPRRDFEKEEYWMYKKPTHQTRRISAAVLAYKHARKERIAKLQAEFKARKEEFEKTKEKEIAALEKELQEMGVNTNVGSLEELFKEMGLGPPYVMPKERYRSNRWKKLEKKFQKWAAMKQKNATPT